MQCAHILGSGKRCARKIKFGTYCWQHKEEYKETSDILNLKLFISDALKTLKNIIFDTSALQTIENIFIQIYQNFSNLSAEELQNLINTIYIGSLKKLALTDLQNSNYLQLLISDLLHKLIATLQYYTQKRKVKNIGYKELNFAIFESSELYAILNPGLLPSKYLSVNNVQLAHLPISLVLGKLRDNKINVSEDALYFIRQYVVGNYLALSETDRLECGFADNIQDFFYQWFNLIKDKLKVTYKLSYKNIADLILSYDIFHECQEEREHVYMELLGSEISKDVMSNILSGYIY